MFSFSVSSSALFAVLTFVREFKHRYMRHIIFFESLFYFAFLIASIAWHFCQFSHFFAGGWVAFDAGADTRPLAPPRPPYVWLRTTPKTTPGQVNTPLKTKSQQQLKYKNTKWYNEYKKRKIRSGHALPQTNPWRLQKGKKKAKTWEHVWLNQPR